MTDKDGKELFSKKLAKRHRYDSLSSFVTFVLWDLI